MKSKQLTKEEVKKRVRETLAEVLATLFGMSEKAATEKIRSNFNQALDESSLIQAIFVHSLNKSMESAIKGSKGKRCTEEELEIVLSQIRASAPEMASRLRQVLKETQRQLPRHGGPGRTEILTSTEKLEACDQISSLLKLGKMKGMPNIFEAVAKTIQATKYKKVSTRTIKRVWLEREALYLG